MTDGFLLNLESLSLLTKDDFSSSIRTVQKTSIITTIATFLQILDIPMITDKIKLYHKIKQYAKNHDQYTTNGFTEEHNHNNTIKQNKETSNSAAKTRHGLILLQGLFKTD